MTENNIQTKFIHKITDSEIEISCMNLESVQMADLVLTTKLKNWSISTEQQNNPKIKITGIENVMDMDIKSIENDINARNFKQIIDKSKVLHMYDNKKTKTNTVLMEVLPEVYKYIRENKNRVSIGHQYCKAYNVINIAPCLNSGRFGHNVS